jgi:hypothetical protein
MIGSCPVCGNTFDLAISGRDMNPSLPDDEDVEADELTDLGGFLVCKDEKTAEGATYYIHIRNPNGEWKR